MTLQERVGELIAACFTGIWVESLEPHEALVELAQLCRNENWTMITWDVDRGLDGNAGSSGDPLAAIRSLGSISTDAGTTVLVMKNLHRFMGSVEVLQALQHQLVDGKQNRTIVIALAPAVSIPAELDKLFVVAEHELPRRKQLAAIASEIATETGELPAENELAPVLDAAAGLTRMEAENAFSLSLVRNGRISPEAIWELKASTLKKSGLLRLYKGLEDFESLGGLQSLKAFCRRSLMRSGQSCAHPRGVLLLGVPGTGKSAFAKALGRESGRPTLVLDIGALMGSLVGQTESNIRKALQIADAMAPCILFVDELEKGLSGVGSSSQGDSGVSSRLFGTLLSWMNDHTSDVYIVATCNDISQMPPELTRAERFDGIAFLDLPGRKQKNAIWSQYIGAFELEADQERPKDDSWTGAEIRACCRLASLLDVPLAQAAQNVVPVAVTAAESVDRLRTWASGRCLDAEVGSIYQHDAKKRTRRRKVVSNPDLN